MKEEEIEEAVVKITTEWECKMCRGRVCTQTIQDHGCPKKLIYVPPQCAQRAYRSTWATWRIVHIIVSIPPSDVTI